MIKPKTRKTILFVFGFLLLTTMSATLVVYSPTSIKVAFAQEDPTAAPLNNSTNTQNMSNQNNTASLPSQQGFSVRVLATNFSQPHNIIYGPYNLLWITERFGKVITLVDPVNGAKLNSIPVPGVHQSQGQDGLLGMAFDPNFNNTHHIYVAYTYDADPSKQLKRMTKITQFSYDPTTGTIGQ